MKTTAFEHETCGRCGGSGRYSFNLMYGDICFRCKGYGFVFTKRGAAASEFYIASLKKLASQLVIGEMVRIDPVPYITAGGWYSVTKITSESVTAEKGNEQWTLGINEKVRYQNTEEEKRAKVNAALEYQATLTKNGTPRKVKQNA